MSARTAGDPRNPWLQMDRHRLEQALQTNATKDREAPAPMEQGNDSDSGAAAPQYLPGSRADRRATTDRRVLHDRRQLIRFEDDRRSGIDRRAGTQSWEIA